MPYAVLKHSGDSVVLVGEYENFSVAVGVYNGISSGLLVQVMESKKPIHQYIPNPTQQITPPPAPAPVAATTASVSSGKKKE